MVGTSLVLSVSNYRYLLKSHGLFWIIPGSLEWVNAFSASAWQIGACRAPFLVQTRCKINIGKRKAGKPSKWLNGK
jgi:hypothetical protein